MQIDNLLKKIVKRLKDYPNLKAVVLYGSYARKDFAKGSDIDLLIVIDAEKPIHELSRILRIIRDIDKENKVSLQLTNLKDGNYSLYQNVLREGKILMGKFDIGVKELKLKPYKVINYDLSKVGPSIKVKVSKRVNGNIVRKVVGKKVKEYRYMGLKDEEGVIVLPKSSLLLPEDIARGFTQFLELNNVTYKQFNVWKE